MFFSNIKKSLQTETWGKNLHKHKSKDGAWRQDHVFLHFLTERLNRHWSSDHGSMLLRITANYHTAVATSKHSYWHLNTSAALDPKTSRLESVVQLFITPPPTPPWWHSKNLPWKEAKTTKQKTKSLSKLHLTSTANRDPVCFTSH